uniref:Type II toxin-antitoxin system HicA family toxin n=1 Tax=Steinernema glaseri TaxID=37863 RepID=A0A1I7YZY4_9BILA
MRKNSQPDRLKEVAYTVTKGGHEVHNIVVGSQAKIKPRPGQLVFEPLTDKVERGFATLKEQHNGVKKSLLTV